jgi:hypothetical protein
MNILNRLKEKLRQKKGILYEASTNKIKVHVNVVEMVCDLIEESRI